MDTISKYLNLFHLPFFNSSSSAAKQANQVAAVSKSITSTASTLHTPQLSSGELFGVLIIVGVLLLALTLGRTRTLISTLSIYVAFALQAMFPYFGWLMKHQSYVSDLEQLRVFVFLIIYAIVFLLLNRSLLKARFNLAEASFLSVVLMGVAQLGLMISIILNLAPSFYDIAQKIPAQFLPYFATQQSLFIWALVPILLLVFQKGRE